MARGLGSAAGTLEVRPVDGVAGWLPQVTVRWVRVAAAVLVHTCSVHAAFHFGANPAEAVAQALTVAAVDLVTLAMLWRRLPGRVDRGGLDVVESGQGTRGHHPMLRGDMCGACEALAPLRSAHCDTCATCVPQADHHSLLIGRCVGANNRARFVLMVAAWSMTWVLATASGLRGLWGMVAGECLGWSLAWYPIAVAAGCAGTVVAWHELALQARLVSRNLTSVEEATWPRLMHFKGTQGFYNPFDRGLVSNWLELMGVAGTDWSDPASSVYTVMDIPGHPLRSRMLERVQRVHELELSGATVGLPAWNGAAVAGWAGGTGAGVGMANTGAAASPQVAGSSARVGVKAPAIAESPVASSHQAVLHTPSPLAVQ